MAHGPKSATVIDGKIVEVVMDEHITDPDDPRAVDALEVQVKEHGDRGSLDEVLTADHPDAVQVLPPEPHPGLRRLPEDHPARQEAEQEAAEQVEGTVSVDTGPALPPQPADNVVEPAAEESDEPEVEESEDDESEDDEK